MTCPNGHPVAHIMVATDEFDTGQKKLVIMLDCEVCDRNGSWIYWWTDPDDLIDIGADIAEAWVK